MLKKKNKRLLVIFLAMILTAPTINILAESHEENGNRENRDQWDWEVESQYNVAPPIIDGNVTGDWNESHFKELSLKGMENETILNMAVNNDQNTLYMSIVAKNATFPNKPMGGPDMGPAGDMFFIAFDDNYDGFNEGDNAFVFCIYWNETENISIMELDTFLDRPLDYRDDGAEFNVSGDPMQDGELVINFTGDWEENATGDYVIELAFPLNSGEEWDFNLSEGYDMNYGADFTMRVWDYNTMVGYGSDMMWLDLEFLDTDGDGYPDLWEDDLGTNKTNATSYPDDYDGDMMPDAYDEDDDDDGYMDEDEILAGLDAFRPCN